MFVTFTNLAIFTAKWQLVNTMQLVGNGVFFQVFFTARYIYYSLYNKYIYYTSQWACPISELNLYHMTMVFFSEYYDLGNLNPGCFTRGHGIRLRIPRLSGKFDFFKCKVIKSCVLKLKVNWMVFVSYLFLKGSV
jgi:hypothetical protein